MNERFGGIKEMTVLPDLVFVIDVRREKNAVDEANKLGIPVIYYISPQVWAWARWRVKKIARLVDLMLVILPFEEELFRAVGGHATFVGHPLLDAERVGSAPEKTPSDLGLDPARPILALFPGSRDQEIRRHWELFLKTGEEVRRMMPEVQLAAARAVCQVPLIASGGAGEARHFTEVFARADVDGALAALRETNRLQHRLAQGERIRLKAFSSSPADSVLTVGRPWGQVRGEAVPSN